MLHIQDSNTALTVGAATSDISYTTATDSGIYLTNTGNLVPYSAEFSGRNSVEYMIHQVRNFTGKFKFLNKIWKRKPKQRKIVIEDIAKFFSAVKDQKVSYDKKKLKNRIAAFQNLMEYCSINGQTALMEQALEEIDIIRMETTLYAAGIDTYIAENVLNDFIDRFQKEESYDPNALGEKSILHFTDIKNYTRIIPANVTKKLLVAKTLGIFAKFVVLHMDLAGDSVKLTQKEKKEAAEKAKDPILFGIISDIKKFYYIGDWQDEFCTLTLKDIIDVVGKKEIGKITNKILIEEKTNGKYIGT